MSQVSSALTMTVRRLFTTRLFSKRFIRKSGLLSLLPILSKYFYFICIKSFLFLDLPTVSYGSVLLPHRKKVPQYHVINVREKIIVITISFHVISRYFHVILRCSHWELAYIPVRLRFSFTKPCKWRMLPLEALDLKLKSRKTALSRVVICEISRYFMIRCFHGITWKRYCYNNKLFT